MNHDLQLTDADDGTPTRCQCSCGWSWTRPEGDDHADTLQHAARAHLALTTIEYLTSIPRDPIPTGRIVAHNHVRPVHPLGLNGFRAWTDDASDRYEPCDCEWAAGRLAQHHRVRRPS